MKHNIKKFFNLLAVSIFIILITSSCAGAYNASWQYARTIVVNHSQVSQSFTGIPIKVFINQSTNINANGTDVRITDNSTDTDVPREIVFYNTTTGNLSLFFKGNISNVSDTTYVLRYGNSAATEPAINSAYGAQNVWDSNYLVVSHMNQEPHGNVTGSIKDSTSNQNNLTPTNFVYNSSVMLPFGRGILFNATLSEHLDSINNLGITGTAVRTFEVYTNSVTVGMLAITGTDGSNLRFGTYVGSPDLQFFGHGASDYDTGSILSTTGDDSDVATYDGSVVRTYAHGLPTVTPSKTEALATGNNKLEIGWRDTSLTPYLSGIVTETRVSNIQRSANYINTTSKNMLNPTSTGNSAFFSSFGNQTANNGTVPIITDWNNSKTMNNSLQQFTVNTTEGVTFTVSSNQSVTYQWVVNNTIQANTSGSLNYTFNQTNATVYVNVTGSNTNGTTQLITFPVYVYYSGIVITVLSSTVFQNGSNVIINTSISDPLNTNLTCLLTLNGTILSSCIQNNFGLVPTGNYTLWINVSNLNVNNSNVGTAWQTLITIGCNPNSYVSFPNGVELIQCSNGKVIRSTGWSHNFGPQITTGLTNANQFAKGLNGVVIAGDGNGYVSPSSDYGATFPSGAIKVSNLTQTSLHWMGGGRFLATDGDNRVSSTFDNGSTWAASWTVPSPITHLALGAYVNPGIIILADYFQDLVTRSADYGNASTFSVPAAVPHTDCGRENGEFWLMTTSFQVVIYGDYCGNVTKSVDTGLNWTGPILTYLSKDPFIAADMRNGEIIAGSTANKYVSISRNSADSFNSNIIDTGLSTGAAAFYVNDTTAVAMDYTSSKIAYSQDLTHYWLNVSTNVTVLGNTPSGCSGINALMYYPTNNTIVLNNQTSTLCTIWYDLGNTSIISYDGTNYTLTDAIILSRMGSTFQINNTSLIFNPSTNGTTGIETYGYLKIYNATISSLNTSPTAPHGYIMTNRRDTNNFSFFPPYNISNSTFSYLGYDDGLDKHLGIYLGYSVASSPTDAYFVGNTLEHVYAMAFTSNNITMKDNVFNNMTCNHLCTTNGGDVFSPPSSGANGTYVNDTFNNGAGNNFYLVGVTNSTISHIFSNNALNGNVGIYIKHTKNNQPYTDIYVTNASGDGLDIENSGGDTNATYINISINGSGSYGLSLIGGNNTSYIFVSNLTMNGTANGIHVYNYRFVNNSTISNIPAGPAFALSADSHFSVFRNTTTSNVKYGAYTAANDSDMYFIDSNISTNTAVAYIYKFSDNYLDFINMLYDKDPLWDGTNTNGKLTEYVYFDDNATWYSATAVEDLVNNLACYAKTRYVQFHLSPYFSMSITQLKMRVYLL
jgi:hypothetical protein